MGWVGLGGWLCSAHVGGRLDLACALACVAQSCPLGGKLAPPPPCSPRLQALLWSASSARCSCSGSCCCCAVWAAARTSWERWSPRPCPPAGAPPGGGEGGGGRVGFLARLAQRCRASLRPACVCVCGLWGWRGLQLLQHHLCRATLSSSDLSPPRPPTSPVAALPLMSCHATGLPSSTGGTSARWASRVCSSACCSSKTS